MSPIPVPSVVLHAHTVLHKAWVLTLAYPVVRGQQLFGHFSLITLLCTCLTWGPTIQPCSSIWCRQSYHLQQLLLESCPFFKWQEKNKGRSGWDFLREGGEGGIIVFRVHPTCMLQWCFHKWFEMGLRKPLRVSLKPIWNQPFKKKHQTNWELFVAGRDYYLFCRHCCEREAKPSTTYRVYIFPASFWGRWILDLWHCMPGKSRKIENWSRHWEQPWICCSCKGAATEHSPPVRSFPRRVTRIRRIYILLILLLFRRFGRQTQKQMSLQAIKAGWLHSL